MLNTEFWIFSIICLLSALPRCFLAVGLNCSGCWAIIVRIAKNSAKSNLHFWSVQISLPLKPLLFVCKKKISSGFRFYLMLLSLTPNLIKSQSLLKQGTSESAESSLIGFHVLQYINVYWSLHANGFTSKAMAFIFIFLEIL